MSDFTEIPDKTLDESLNYDVLVTSFENGVEQRRLKAANPKRTWRLVFINRTITEMGTLKTFFTGKYGSLTAFTWTNPNDSTEYTVRFLENSFDVERTGYDSCNFQFSFSEVK